MKYLQSEGVYLPIGRKKHLLSLNSQTHCLSSCFVLCSGITRLNDSSTPTSFRRNSDEMCGLHVAVKALNGMLLWQGTCWISSRRMLEGPSSAWYAECHCPAYKNKVWWRECSWFIYIFLSLYVFRALLPSLISILSNTGGEMRTCFAAGEF